MSSRAGWLSAGAMVILSFFAIGLLSDALAPAPQGPPLSSFSTVPAGVAAWASLLERAGHPVSRLRAPLARARLSPSATVVVLASDAVSPADAAHLLRFVSAGGRLVINGPAAGLRSADRPGRSLIAAVTPRGAGAQVLLNDPAPLENDRLADGDNAEQALRLVGGAGRPVVFAEAIHGFGPATGLAALPGRWWLAFAIIVVAGAAFVVARGRRLGGADPFPGPAPQPSNAYLEAMALTVARAADRDGLDELVGQRQPQPRESSGRRA